MVVVPACRGEMGILPRHAPLVAQLTIGEVRVKTLGEGWLSLAIAGGFVKVQFDKVIVLADAAELAGEIDAGRSEAALAKAQSRIALAREGRAAADDEIDLYYEELAVKRAKNRLKVLHKA